MPDLASLQERLGYVFADAGLLDMALTHVSAIPTQKIKSYQRLEFLGDRVLGLVVSNMLYATFPNAEEGELSRRLAELVRKESCTEVARGWQVGPLLRLGEGEITSGARDNAAIIADVCEAIVGAVFLDGGFDAAQALVERAFEARMHAPRRPLRDAKTALQEWAQGRGLAAPTYEITDRSGPDHAPRFRVAVRVDTMSPTEGQGTSKRTAEQDAAARFLSREGIRISQS
ncbi:ribonuclease-3 [Pseudochelatococcus lubricantis]|uniref:Ribonuclease 3 n=1 Tax=Pseudochelatococcus lubricantis TaxID=1538102 RepID=A0ABX0V1H7_9HYPH|nr:ribonuclease III [Pseudochelatococcus lubricantis]NIJ57685.1 ribonuclease-3 [Pseudochelatococcus lubricantis]